MKIENPRPEYPGQWPEYPGVTAAARVMSRDEGLKFDCDLTTSRRAGEIDGRRPIVRIPCGWHHSSAPISFYDSAASTEAQSYQDRS